MRLLNRTVLLNFPRRPLPSVNRLGGGGGGAVFRNIDKGIHWINYSPKDSAIGFRTTYPLDSDLSGGQCYPTFEQPGPVSRI